MMADAAVTRISCCLEISIESYGVEEPDDTYRTSIQACMLPILSTVLLCAAIPLIANAALRIPSLQSADMT